LDRKTVLYSLALIALSLFIGMTGYHLLEDLSWIVSFLNAPNVTGRNGACKHTNHFWRQALCGYVCTLLRPDCYRSRCVILAPVIHRVLHRFHL